MIVINKNSINSVCLKLKALSTLSDPYYLFQMYNAFDESNEVFFNAEDISDYTCSYNLFNITETGNTFTILSAATINLFPLESWNYRVYEATGNTLSVSATTGVVLSEGKVVVVGNSSFNNTINSIYL